MDRLGWRITSYGDTLGVMRTFCQTEDSIKINETQAKVTRDKSFFRNSEIYWSQPAEFISLAPTGLDNQITTPWFYTAIVSN